MKADWIDEAQELTQSMVDRQVERIRASFTSPALSSTECEGCGNTIPEARRRIIPGVRLCVDCQTIDEFNLRIGNGVFDEN